MSDSVVLFDGVCNLCNRSIDFIISRDPDRHFRFAALQSDSGRKLAEKSGLDPNRMESLVLIQCGRVFTQSAAALRIARILTFPWKLLSVFLILPEFLRDPVYNFIARHRYRWFGKREQCRVPTAELQALFLE